MVSREKFFKVMAMYARCQLEPKLMVNEAFVKEVMQLLDDIEDFKDIASRLNSAWHIYDITQQAKEGR